MNEYKGIKYKEISAGKWQIVLPSGVKSTIECESDAVMRAILAQMVELAG